MSENTKRKIFITSALPYANGPIHLGHLVEYVQTDIWVRFQKLLGNTTVYICADDTHGTPVMLKAQKERISPEQLIEKVWHEHKRDFSAFFIDFDCYYTTHSKENRELSNKIYSSLVEAKLIKPTSRMNARWSLPSRGCPTPDNRPCQSVSIGIPAKGWCAHALVAGISAVSPINIFMVSFSKLN